jgi:F0F1-type ATP synthase assembly protein I
MDWLRSTLYHHPEMLLLPALLLGFYQAFYDDMLENSLPRNKWPVNGWRAYPHLITLAYGRIGFLLIGPLAIVLGIFSTVFDVGISIQQARKQGGLLAWSLLIGHIIGAVSFAAYVAIVWQTWSVPATVGGGEDFVPDMLLMCGILLMAQQHVNFSREMTEYRRLQETYIVLSVGAMLVCGGIVLTRVTGETVSVLAPLLICGWFLYLGYFWLYKRKNQFRGRLAIPFAVFHVLGFLYMAGVVVELWK